MVADKVNINNSLHADNKYTKLNKFTRRRKICNVRRESVTNEETNQLVVLKSYVGPKMKCLRVLIDTGAQENVISEDACKKAGYNLRPSLVKMVNAQNEELPVVGECTIDIHFGSRQYSAKTIATPSLID